MVRNISRLDNQQRSYLVIGRTFNTGIVTPPHAVATLSQQVTIRSISSKCSRAYYVAALRKRRPKSKIETSNYYWKATRITRIRIINVGFLKSKTLVTCNSTYVSVYNAFLPWRNISIDVACNHISSMR